MSKAARTHARTITSTLDHLWISITAYLLRFRYQLITSMFSDKIIELESTVWYVFGLVLSLSMTPLRFCRSHTSTEQVTTKKCTFDMELRQERVKVYEPSRDRERERESFHFRMPFRRQHLAIVVFLFSSQYICMNGQTIEWKTEIGFRVEITHDRYNSIWFWSGIERKKRRFYNFIDATWEFDSVLCKRPSVCVCSKWCDSSRTWSIAYFEKETHATDSSRHTLTHRQWDARARECVNQENNYFGCN